MYPSSAGSEHQVPLLFSGVFVVEEVGVGDRAGDTSTVDVQTLLEAFLNMSLRSACFSNEAFSGKNKPFGLGTTILRSQIIRISELLGIGLKEFCCISARVPV
jgi:hypothetical protein